MVLNRSDLDLQYGDAIVLRKADRVLHGFVAMVLSEGLYPVGIRLDDAPANVAGYWWLTRDGVSCAETITGYARVTRVNGTCVVEDAQAYGQPVPDVCQLAAAEVYAETPAPMGSTWFFERLPAWAVYGIGALSLAGLAWLVTT